jgi:hypothetical protein
MAYPGDWTAYRLLLVLGRLVPGAMQPQQPPRFAVKSVVLLRMLEGWLLPRRTAVDAGADGDGRGSATATADATAAAAPDGGGAATAAAAAAGAVGAVSKRAPTGANGWAASAVWAEVAGRCDAHLMEHQRDAVARMLRRDATRGVPGHFVVMDTGLGKTVTAVAYLIRRLGSTDTGKHVRSILWVTPKHTVGGLLVQLRNKWKCPVVEVQKPKRGKKGAATCHLKDFAVNVVNSDHLRDLIKLDLAARAPGLAVVFDEVDTMYEATQRTSVGDGVQSSLATG